VGRYEAKDEEKRDDGWSETLVRINRSAAVVKGGRRFSFSALMVIGDGKGTVGVGYGKAREVPAAIEKGVSDARKNKTTVPLEGTTIPHEVWGRCGSAKVLLMPAPAGTGIIAGASSRAVLASAGIRDILTKSYGSPNPVNLVKATLNGLKSIRTREQVTALRGVELD